MTLTHKESASNGGKKSWQIRKKKHGKNISEIMRKVALARYKKQGVDNGLAK